MREQGIASAQGIPLAWWDRRDAFYTHDFKIHAIMPSWNHLTTMHLPGREGIVVV